MKREDLKRQITYRVGWKQGKISIPDSSEKQNRHHQYALILENVVERIVWRPLPIVPMKWIPIGLCVLPIVSFLITWALVYMLVNE